MRNALIVASKEFKSYFRTTIAYVFLTVFLVFMGWFFFRVGSPPFFARGVVEMRNFFGLLPWMFIVFIPAISMRVWSEERKLGTLEVLLTMPLREGEAVLGKFLAGYGLLLVFFILTLPLPIVLSVLGNPDFGPIWGGYAGSVLMGGAYLAIGLFASGLTENQIVAYILGFVTCLALFVISILPFQGILPIELESFFTYISLGTHFQAIERGVLDTRDVAYYLSVMVFFLYLNTRTLKSRG